jgi:hypothetical protein
VESGDGVTLDDISAFIIKARNEKAEKEVV